MHVSARLCTHESGQRSVAILTNSMTCDDTGVSWAHVKGVAVQVLSILLTVISEPTQVDHQSLSPFPPIFRGDCFILSRTTNYYVRLWTVPEGGSRALTNNLKKKIQLEICLRFVSSH